MLENVRKNDTPLPALTANQEKAVRFLMAGKLTDEEIAVGLGIAAMTLYRWKRLPAFKKRLDQLRAELREEMGRNTIADQLERLQERDERWQAHRKLRRNRAARFSDPELALDEDCADELATGMYKKKVYRRYDKETGALIGEEIEAVHDTSLYRALHDDELLTAKELGEIITKNELSGPGGKPIQMQMEVNIVGYSHGGILDAFQYWKQLHEAGRLPQTPEERRSILKELDDRERATRMGKPVPPMSEPYIPALDELLEQED